MSNKNFRINNCQNTSAKFVPSNDKYHFCIFHKNLDAFVESNLLERLEVDEKRVYLPSKCDIPGKTWFHNLDTAIQSSEVVIILLNEEFLNDGWCRYITEKVIVSKELKSVIFGIDMALNIQKLPLHLQCIAPSSNKCLGFDPRNIGSPINQTFFESIENPSNTNHGWFKPLCGSIMKVLAKIFSGWHPKTLDSTNRSDHTSLFRSHVPIEKKYDACIIHSIMDDLCKEIFKRLKPYFQAGHKNVFSTAENLPPGKALTQAIIEAMVASKCTILLLTEATKAQFGPILMNNILQLGWTTLPASFVLLEMDMNAVDSYLPIQEILNLLQELEDLDRPIRCHIKCFFSNMVMKVSSKFGV